MPLFGREHEVATLEGFVDRVHERGEALVVRGAPGIGKSALLGAAVERAEAGRLLVSTASGVQSETHLPFAGLHQLLRPLLGAADQLPARQREALLGAFGMAGTGDPEPFLVALAVLTLLGDAAARRPLLIVVDDVQWLDGPTIEVLGFVARRLRSDPIVLLMALRDGHPTSLDAGDVPELRLGGLAPEAAEALLDARGSGLGVGLRWRVLSEAAGNPLALVELPLALQAGTVADETGFLPLTARLERAFAARLAELPPHTRGLLLVAAANDGHDLADALAGGAMVTGACLTAEALAPALDAGLVELHDQALRFRHPLVRSAIYHKAGRTERLAAHAALARVHERDPDRRAWHRAAAIAHRDESVAAPVCLAYPLLRVSARRGDRAPGRVRRRRAGRGGRAGTAAGRDHGGGDRAAPGGGGQRGAGGRRPSPADRRRAGLRARPRRPGRRAARAGQAGRPRRAAARQGRLAERGARRGTQRRPRTDPAAGHDGRGGARGG
nr:AAA family ATPase [Nonomuraea gerenzanensis]